MALNKTNYHPGIDDFKSQPQSRAGSQILTAGGNSIITEKK
jgi:hypothetical protein